MNKGSVQSLIADTGLVPSLRLGSAEDARFAAEALVDAGIPIVEITMTTPGALMVIEGLVKSHADVAVGAGTVLDAATARACMDAGARFLTSPGMDVSMVAAAAKYRVLVFPGVFTPTDVIAAVQAGADLVKLFPCAPWDGAAYLKALAGPFPGVGFIASGGITLNRVQEFLRAGAVAVGVGGDLVPRQAVQDRDRRWIGELARRFLTAVASSRSAFAPPHAPGGER